MQLTAFVLLAAVLHKPSVTVTLTKTPFELNPLQNKNRQLKAQQTAMVSNKLVWMTGKVTNILCPVVKEELGQ